MSTSWKTGAYSKNTTPVSVDDALLNEKGVILLQGKNIYGDQIFTYLELTLKSLIQLRDKMRRKEDFMPAEYGTVLAAGRGDPSPELKSEMAVAHQMVDVPKPASATASPAPAAVPQPKLWDD
jgi:hypothetical protein